MVSLSFSSSWNSICCKLVEMFKVAGKIVLMNSGFVFNNEEDISRHNGEVDEKLDFNPAKVFKVATLGKVEKNL